jgi:hypothetical protein
MKPKSSGHSPKFWLATIAALNVLHFWLFFHLSSAHPMQFWITIAIHMTATIGQLWMVGHWFIKRREKLRWESWMWLFIVPWGFLWYVFEKCERPEFSLLDTSL